ncbi:hypothetical protein B0O99DRAFT_689291 [Bisporella sp. PMI_857]|nr:hypothetical protein B0O99DRAFT_689291 [Bisporella sp. PMI_857]
MADEERVRAGLMPYAQMASYFPNVPRKNYDYGGGITDPRVLITPSPSHSRNSSANSSRDDERLHDQLYAELRSMNADLSDKGVADAAGIRNGGVKDSSFESATDTSVFAPSCRLTYPDWKLIDMPNGETREYWDGKYKQTYLASESKALGDRGSFFDYTAVQQLASPTDTDQLGAFQITDPSTASPTTDSSATTASSVAATGDTAQSSAHGSATASAVTPTPAASAEGENGEDSTQATNGDASGDGRARSASTASSNGGKKVGGTTQFIFNLNDDVFKPTPQQQLDFVHATLSNTPRMGEPGYKDAFVEFIKLREQQDREEGRDASNLYGGGNTRVVPKPGSINDLLARGATVAFPAGVPASMNPAGPQNGLGNTQFTMDALGTSEPDIAITNPNLVNLIDLAIEGKITPEQKQQMRKGFYDICAGSQEQQTVDRAYALSDANRKKANPRSANTTSAINLTGEAPPLIATPTRKGRGRGKTTTHGNLAEAGEMKNGGTNVRSVSVPATPVKKGSVTKRKNDGTTPVNESPTKKTAVTPSASATPSTAATSPQISGIAADKNHMMEYILRYNLEYIRRTVMAGKPVPGHPEIVDISTWDAGATWKRLVENWQDLEKRRKMVSSYNSHIASPNAFSLPPLNPTECLPMGGFLSAADAAGNISDITQVSEKARRDVKLLIQQYATAAGKVTELTQKVAELTQKDRDSAQKMAELTRKNKDSARKIAELTAQLTKSQSQNSLLLNPLKQESPASAPTVEVSQLQNENAQLKENIASLRTMISTLAAIK